MFIILKDKIITANIPSGWVFREASNCPWKMWLMDCPRPHPGQKFQPAFLSGHKVKCSPLSNMANNSSPLVHVRSSIGIRLSIVER
jgi:hypothetical protein